MSDKAMLLRDADEAFGELHRAIDGLTDEEAGRVWLGTWGVREILIHISGWHDAMASALDNVAKGEPAYAAGMYDDYDALERALRRAEGGREDRRRHRGAGRIASKVRRRRRRRARDALRGGGRRPRGRSRAPGRSTIASTRPRSASGEGDRAVIGRGDRGGVR